MKVAKLKTLPTVLSPNTLYLITDSLGVSVYLSNGTGTGYETIVDKSLVDLYIEDYLKTAQQAPAQDPTMTYTSGRLSKVTYSDGTVKSFDYDSSGRLSKSTKVSGGKTTVKNITYDDDGNILKVVTA
jgi:YD repeat-containing protein